MKLRSTILGALAAVAMIGGAITPTLADVQPEVNASVNVNDVGTFEFWLWGVGSIGSVDVTSTTGGSVTYGQTLQVNDQRATSPGWNLELSISDFSDGNGHTIEASNVGLTVQRFNYASSCMTSAAPPPNPTNAYQTVSDVTGSGHAGGHFESAPIAYPLTAVSADSGRGCGNFITGLTNLVKIPAGTYTGGPGVGATYTSTITVSDTSAP